MGERCVRNAEVKGSNPSISTTSERTLLRSDFFLQKNQPHAPSFLLFRKKARSAQLLPCKRVRDGSLSLPPFCAMRLRREYLFGSFFLTRFLHDFIQYLYSAILFSLTAEIGMIEYENWDLHIPVKSCIIKPG